MGRVSQQAPTVPAPSAGRGPRGRLCRAGLRAIPPHPQNTIRAVFDQSPACWGCGAFFLWFAGGFRCLKPDSCLCGIKRVFTATPAVIKANVWLWFFRRVAGTTESRLAEEGKALGHGRSKKRHRQPGSERGIPSARHLPGPRRVTGGSHPAQQPSSSKPTQWFEVFPRKLWRKHFQ